jgi:hypothetical protein
MAADKPMTWAVTVQRNWMNARFVIPFIESPAHCAL